MGDMTMEARIGSLMVCMTAEGQSWNPDVADDMQARVSKGMESLVALCKREEVLHLIAVPNTDDFPDFDDEEGAANGNPDLD